MVGKRTFKSDAFEFIHATAASLHEAGVADRATMRWFDEACLTAPPAIEPA
jgi:putative transcriptional regulator